MARAQRTINARYRICRADFGFLSDVAYLQACIDAIEAIAASEGRATWERRDIYQIGRRAPACCSPLHRQSAGLPLLAMPTHVVATLSAAAAAANAVTACAICGQDDRRRR